MASRYFSEFKEKKLAAKGRRPTGPKGVAPTASITERTARWPDPTPHWATSFNRTTKVPVVKTRTKKGGID